MPVLQNYITGIQDKGAVVRYVSKWANGVIALINSSDLAEIEELNFVTNVRFLGEKGKRLLEDQNIKVDKDQYDTRIADYGLATNHVEMLNADQLNAEGYTGEGKLIAVLDAGFRAVNKLPHFSHLFSNDQVISTLDFINGSCLLYTSPSPRDRG